MKKITCPCGAEFKTHSVDELYEIAQIHAATVHKTDFPQGISREQVNAMVKDA